MLSVQRIGEGFWESCKALGWQPVPACQLFLSIITPALLLSSLLGGKEQRDYFQGINARIIRNIGQPLQLVPIESKIPASLSNLNTSRSLSKSGECTLPVLEEKYIQYQTLYCYKAEDNLIN